MEIFKQLKNLGYKHYIDLTIEELDKLPIDNIEKRIEYSLVIDWFREKHDIHIQIIINSWIKREYEYRIHTTNLYVNSHKFVDNPILGNYYYVLENAIFHCINIVDDMKKSKKFFK